MMKYPDLLDADISRVGLQESQKYNLISGRLVTDIVKTSFGPRGMEKMYIDILGEDTLTNHGGAFLRKIDVTHPAAKSVIDWLVCHMEENFDCCKFLGSRITNLLAIFFFSCSTHNPRKFSPRNFIFICSIYEWDLIR